MAVADGGSECTLAMKALTVTVQTADNVSPVPKERALSLLKSP